MLQSLSKTSLETLVAFYEADTEIIISEAIDTMQPSVISMEATQIVLQLMLQNADHVKKFGKSEKATAAAKKLIRLFELVSKFNKMTGEMNTLKLQNREFYTKMKLAQKETSELKVKLANVEKSFKEL